MNTETKGIAIFLRPDVEVHTAPTRVIGRRTTCESAEHPYLSGHQVVVVAVLKNALRDDECQTLTTDDEIRAAGGVGPDDRLEVAPVLPDGTLSSPSPPAIHEPTTFTASATAPGMVPGGGRGARDDRAEKNHGQEDDDQEQHQTRCEAPGEGTAKEGRSRRQRQVGAQERAAKEAGRRTPHGRQPGAEGGRQADQGDHGRAAPPRPASARDGHGAAEEGSPGSGPLRVHRGAGRHPLPGHPLQLPLRRRDGRLEGHGSRRPRPELMVRAGLCGAGHRATALPHG